MTAGDVMMMDMAPCASSPLAGESVLVTGGSGAFGNAFVRRALDDGARRVAVFSRSEATQAAMRARYAHESRLRFFVGDVRDATRVMDAMRGVTVCVHAAALKRVETCEADPHEAIATNVTGTEHVVRACIERGVRKALFLSTDKAAAPNTLYGATKLTAERFWTRANVYAAGTSTRFAATRYGNVLGSTGSVVPLWREQLQAGNPVTVTDPAMTRFLMTMEDAVALVVRALTHMQGGEVFVPMIGAARIDALLNAVALSVGRPSYTMVHVGLRPGEKMHETLIAPDEIRMTARVQHCYVIHLDDASRDATTMRELVKPSAPEFPEHGYRSDLAPQLDVDALLTMLGGMHPSLEPHTLSPEREHARV